VLRERKPPPRRLTSIKSDPGFESAFPELWPDSDPDVAGSLPMLCINDLVGVSHFHECHENQPATA